MNRVKNLSIVLLVSLFLIPMIYPVAAGESYVDIDEGDEYAWEIDLDEDVLDEWEDVDGDALIDFDDFEDIDILKIEITDIGKEDDVSIKWADDETGVEVEVIWYAVEDKDNIKYSEGDDEDTFILHGEDANSVIVAFSLYFGYWFIATNIDWDNIEDAFGAMQGVKEIDVSDNEINVEYNMNLTDDMEVSEVKAEWDKDGVLEKYKFKYDGETLIEKKKIDVPEEAFIPGFPPSIFLAIALITIAGLIVVSMRKRIR